MKKIRWISKTEMRKLLEKRCQRVLGIKLATFERNYKAGKYKDVNELDYPGLVDLLALSRFGLSKGAIWQRRQQ